MLAKTFYIETFGCQMNVHDSEKVIGTLRRRGYQQIQSPAEASLVLYNTCSIREKAAQKVFTRLNDFKRAHAKGQKFGVLGCVAQQEGEAIFDAAPHVSLVVGSASYSRLPGLLQRLEAGEDRVTGLSLDTQETFDTPYANRHNPHRAYITIIEGCDKHCAYCVVPFTRGPERSRTSASVIDEASRIAVAGQTEIQLLGQNVNSYRDPSPARLSFADLLIQVADVPGIRRVRFTTSHPRDFGPDIVQAIDSHPGLCNHVHLPVQSGSSALLRRMQRDYTRDEYLERIGWLRASRRPISLSTDIIVGFPGETDADFEQTISLLDAVGYDSIFAFQFSPRPNTAALTLDGALPDEVKRQRLRIVQERQRQIQTEHYQRFLGTMQEVLIEAASTRAENQWRCRTAQNIVLNLTVPSTLAALAAHSFQAAPGQYWNARVIHAGPSSLVGEVVGGPVFIPEKNPLAEPEPDAYFDAPAPVTAPEASISSVAASSGTTPFRIL